MMARIAADGRRAGPAAFIARACACLLISLPGRAVPEESGAVTPKTVPPTEARAMSRAFAETAKALRPSVVRIDVEQSAMRIGPGQRRVRPWGEEGLPDLFERFFGEGLPELRELPRRGTGSGVIFEAKGSIVTNRHVVAGARKVTVTLADGRELSAVVVGKDARTDVAVLRLENPPLDLTAARLGDSDRCEVGEWVLAIGSPLGMDQTVTAGILSGKGRAGRRIQMSGDRIRRYLQTDAKINPGNSGGPLVNLEGEVIGINTLISGGPGGTYGFAIPINEVRSVASILLKEGRVAYAYLGVRVGDLDALDADKREKLGKGAPEKGAYLSEVSPGGPAQRAGLKAGDVITGLDERKVEWAADVVDHVSSKPVGATVAVRFVRDGKPKTIQVTLGELPPDELESADEWGAELAESLGLWLQTLTPQLATALGLEADTQGVIVTEVAPGGVGARAGLSEGDVVIEIDQKPVASVAQAMRALKGSRQGGHLLRVKGARGTKFVTLTDR